MMIFEPNGSHAQQAIENGKHPMFEKPKKVLMPVWKAVGTTPEVDSSNNAVTTFEEVDEIIWKKEIDQHLTIRNVLLVSCTLRRNDFTI